MIEVLQTIWKPAVEILVLTVGIYYILRFVWGTRGFSILTGFLVVLLTLALITSFFDLTVLKWLLTTFSAFFAVAVLIIFQPELRRLLAQLGNLPLFQTTHEQRENIEVIVQTVERLADVRIGALIAIEQSIQLQESVESGIAIDCVATPEILETIFFPNNAIHDGGVIIKGDRITHAACIFPLSRRADLAKTLGTRHRAAIGLTEETDAIVVAVSEETGSISYAYKGILVRGVTAEELRAFLTSILVKSEKGRGPLEWLRHLRPERIKPGPAVITRTGTPAMPRVEGSSEVRGELNDLDADDDVERVAAKEEAK
jgi:diadenylate cyclase